ncbi:MAG: phosphate ABC transporter permease PstC, partial [Enterobacterales bacterium]|nr:phosphate ABC transporter permease PstC [Enterobacterales bacterium]
MADHPLSKPSLPKKESKIKPPSKNGDVIFGALVKLAALITLLLLGGIIVSLFIASLPSIQKFGFA